MTISDSRRLGNNGSIAALVIAFVCGPSSAQEMPSPDEDIEEIVTTGTRISRSDYIGNSPVYTVGEDQFSIDGTSTPDLLLNKLPQVAPDYSASSVDRGAGGRSAINLRGLGAKRNLVLIDGRRVVGATSEGIVDLNVLPTALIDRVEIITGGASAVYGADAVAGAVNFILKEDFEGVSVNTRGSTSERGDAEDFNASVVFGGLFDGGRGSAAIAYDYYKRTGLVHYDRPFSRESEYPSLGPWGTYAPLANPPSQEAVDEVFGSYGLVAGSAVGSDSFAFNDDGTLISMSLSDNDPPVANFRGDLADPQLADHFFPERFAFEYSPYIGLIIPLERHNVFATAAYQVTDDSEVYAQAITTMYESTLTFNPTGAASSTRGGVHMIPVTNPFIPEDLATLLASRADPLAPFAWRGMLLNLGSRIVTADNHMNQLLLGIRGGAETGWSWDVYAARGDFQNTTIRRNGGSGLRVADLINAPDGGASICEGGLNLFGRPNTLQISDACIAYIDSDSTVMTEVETSIVEATMSGDLGFGLRAGDMSAAIGILYKEDSLAFEPDFPTVIGDIAGYPRQAALAGETDNFDVYAEIYLPLLADIPLVDVLSLTTGLRHTTHSQAGGFLSYKADLDWQLNEAVRLRGSYQRAVRAPNIAELFSPENTARPGINDPCNASSAQRNGPDAASVRQLCISQGISAAVIDNYQQPTPSANALTGGNPSLNEETADTHTIGTVVTVPTGVGSDLSLSADYYQISINDAISSLQAPAFVAQCYDPQFNPTFDINNPFCQLFERSPTDGGIERAQQNLINIGMLEVSGVDLQMDWGFDVGRSGHRLDLSLIGGWIEHSSVQASAGDTVFDYAGTIGQEVGDTFPEWKGMLETKYSAGDFAPYLRARYISAMGNRVNVVDPNAGGTGVPATWYLDLGTSWQVTESLRLYGTISNMLDQEPRVYFPQQQSKTDPSTYDVIGRRFTIGATLDF